MPFPYQSPVPILDSLKKHVAKGYQRCHMPGHKGGAGTWPEFVQLMGTSPLSMDLTELPGLDDLHHPQEAILVAQRLAAQTFGAGETFFLINGASGGLHAALMAAVGPGDVVLVPRHAHRSVWGGLVLTGAQPVYLMPHWHRWWNIPLGIGPAELEQALMANPEAKCLVMVHPTYEGIVSDLPSMVKLAHKAGLTVIADEAHGGHFVLHPRLPVSALEAGADLVVQSTHKVLGALTQAAMLHVRADYPGERVFRSLNSLQSTSPSYLLLASLDAARKMAEDQGPSRLDNLIACCQEARSCLKSISGLRCLGDEVLAEPPVSGYDPTRMVIGARGLGISGRQLARLLRDSYCIQAEMAGSRHVLLLLTYADSETQVKSLTEAFAGLGHRLGQNRRERGDQVFPAANLPAPEVVMSPREAFFAATERLPIRSARGRVAGEMVALYPPGIPVVCPGERLNIDVIEVLEQIRSQEVGWQGTAGARLETIGVVI